MKTVTPAAFARVLNTVYSCNTPPQLQTTVNWLSRLKWPAALESEILKHVDEVKFAKGWY